MSETRRKHLIDMLEILLGDEFIALELIYLDDEEIVDMIINCAFHYKERCEN
jgi:hypothetical protein